MAKIITTRSGFKAIYDEETIKKNMDKYAALFKAVAKKDKMQITLNIKDEKDFLNEVKEIVRGQVKQLAREEIDTILKEEMKRVVEGYVSNVKSSYNNLEKRLEDYLRQHVKATVDGTNYWNKVTYVKEQADKLVAEIVPGMLSRVDIEKQVTSKIKDAVEEAKKEFLKKLLDK